VHAALLNYQEFTMQVQKIKSVSTDILGTSKTGIVWSESVEGTWCASFENWCTREGLEGTGN